MHPGKDRTKHFYAESKIGTKNPQNPELEIVITLGAPTYWLCEILSSALNLSIELNVLTVLTVSVNSNNSSRVGSHGKRELLY